MDPWTTKRILLERLLAGNLMYTSWQKIQPYQNHNYIQKLYPLEIYIRLFAYFLIKNIILFSRCMLLHVNMQKHTFFFCWRHETWNPLLGNEFHVSDSARVWVLKYSRNYNDIEKLYLFKKYNFIQKYNLIQNHIYIQKFYPFKKYNFIQNHIHIQKLQPFKKI